jgi:hypothetical protein
MAFPVALSASLMLIGSGCGDERPPIEEHPHAPPRPPSESLVDEASTTTAELAYDDPEQVPDICAEFCLGEPREQDGDAEYGVESEHLRDDDFPSDAVAQPYVSDEPDAPSVDCADFCPNGFADTEAPRGTDPGDAEDR